MPAEACARLELRRHTIVYLSAMGWHRALLGQRALARECVEHWARHRLPLVVALPPEGSAGEVLLDLHAPRPLAQASQQLAVHRKYILYTAAFPLLTDVARRFRSPVRRDLLSLGAALQARGFNAEVIGDAGWQVLTGLVYAERVTELRIIVRVGDAAQADAVASLLAICRPPRLLLHPILAFADGSDVDWQQWRAALQPGTQGACEALRQRA